MSIDLFCQYSKKRGLELGSENVHVIFCVCVGIFSSMEVGITIYRRNKSYAKVIFSLNPKSNLEMRLTRTHICWLDIVV